MNLHSMLLLIPALLTGCGVGDRAAPWRPVVVDEQGVCFSTDKKDVLSRYYISSFQSGQLIEFASKGLLSLTWPATCVKMKFISGYPYGVSYTLNHRHYRDVFMIDAQGKIIRSQ